MHRSLYSLSRISAMLVLGSAALLAQGTQTCRITGEVIVKGGAPLTGVKVYLTSPSMQGPRSLASDEKGRFALRLLPPGVYTITLSKDGYETVKSVEKIGLDQNYQPRFEMSKTAGAVVEVVASTPAVDKTDVKTASNFAADAIDQLPTGRGMDAVALLTPGVTVGVGGRTQVRGSMTSGNLMLVDGQNIQDNTYANSGVTVIDDAVEETQVITGAISAEYGNVEGGVINTITKSGSNEFSGLVRWTLTNPQWNAVAPLQDRAGITNTLSDIQTYDLGGPIIKDKLWFFGSFYKRGGDTPYTFSNATPGGNPWGNKSGARTDKEFRRQLKLSYQLNQNHQLVYSFMNGRTDVMNRNTNAAEPDATYDGVYTNEINSLAWRAVWNANVTSDIKYGTKKQLLNAGGRFSDRGRIRDADTGLSWQNGPWKGAGAGGAGDHRDNKTLNAKVSIFWEAMGSHQTDTGLDFYRGEVTAKNEQAPTDDVFYAYDIDGVNRMGKGAEIWTFSYTEGKAVNDQIGVYFNDKWSINKNLSIQIGGRFDNYKAKKEDGSKSAGATGFSPRVGLKYDLFGDSTWVFGLSGARYNGKVLEGITNAVTGQGNPSEIDYAWKGSTDRVSFAELTKRSNYNMTTSGITYYSNPQLNVKLSDDLKAPTVDEFQVSAAYSFDHPLFGRGYAKLTGVSKKWNNLFDYKQGNEGHVVDAVGQDHYMLVWVNSDLAERTYRGLEFDGQLAKGNWQLTAGVTWSVLKGNYEGEGTSNPGRGEGLEAWTTIDGASVINRDNIAPYGYLAGHVPIRIRATATRSIQSAYGKTSVGFMYRFDTGARVSDTRNISAKQYGLNGTAASDAGGTLTQFNGRGTRILPAEAYLDMAITHDFPLVKAWERPVTAFVKLEMTNIFNHMQIINFNNAWYAATGVYGAANGGANSAWVPRTTNGKQVSTTDYGAARTIRMSAGFRF